MNGLVIKSPWIERILQTPRTWAIRGTCTKTRGRVGLVKARSGQILGTCQITDCIGPMSVEDLKASAGKEQVPVELLMTSPGAKAYAWVLGDVKAFAEPIPFNAPGGSMIWAKLAPDTVPARYNELEGEAAPKVEVTIMPVVAEMQAQPAPQPQPAATTQAA